MSCKQAGSLNVGESQKAISEASLADSSIELGHGDANQLDEENAYDLVTMTHYLHEMGGPAGYRNVLSRVRRALKPGRTIVVCELPYPDTPETYREVPLYKILTGIQFHEALVGADTITPGELHELLTGAGFSNVRIANQPMHLRIVLLAEKEVA